MLALPSSNGARPNGGVMTGEKDAATDFFLVVESASSKLQNPLVNHNFPLPKTDKPRPHVCGTCQRCFARLEHLKRHERSHTKEKPFECPECARCFARRDLLLRHQQKLHMTTTPLARPRNRRESATSTTAGVPGRVRKNSLANSGNAVMRPRANTISHIEGTQTSTTSSANAATAAASVQSRLMHSHNRHSSVAELPLSNNYNPYNSISSEIGQRAINLGLPKLEIQNSPSLGYSSGLRTAPLLGGFNPEFDYEGLIYGPNSTINPNALHYNDSPHSVALDANTLYHQSLTGDIHSQQFDENLDWLNGFDHQLSFQDLQDHALDGSSPSAISTASQSGISEIMLDGSNNPAASSASMWPHSMLAPQMMTPSQFSLEMGNAGFHDLMSQGPLSPHSISRKNGNEHYFSTPPLPHPSHTALSPSLMSGISNHHQISFGPETPVSVTCNLPSILPIVSITDVSRQTLIDTLQSNSKCVSGFEFGPGGLPSTISFGSRDSKGNELHRSIPSTQDFQRYVAAYIRFFNPHMPFLHIPTLSFDLHSQSSSGNNRTATVSSARCCLLLAMAAIGALYEMERVIAHDLFESTQKMIQICMEDRTKLNSPATDSEKSGMDTTSQSTLYPPIILVQAMLLNLLYCHHCGEQISDGTTISPGVIVNLSCVADLLRPYERCRSRGPELQVDDCAFSDDWGYPNIKSETSEEHQDWYDWKCMEERKRTIYFAYHMSSLLVMFYNHTPILMNSEMTLDLPCDEEFWTADNARSFYSKGGAAMAEHHQLTFHESLGDLIRASEDSHEQRQEFRWNSLFRNNIQSDTHSSDLKLSAFGCLILINAVHNFIWEISQEYHQNTVWTSEQTEKLCRNLEPALKAWEAVWDSNAQNSHERSSPHGIGPLVADSIPLLNLAYIRLNVNFSRIKEKFWQRDWDGVVEQMSLSTGINHDLGNVPVTNDLTSEPLDLSCHTPNFVTSSSISLPPRTTNRTSLSRGQVPQPGHYSSRERHLRKVAFIAVNSLPNSEKFGVKFAEFSGRDLPLYSALCVFDSAQILAEWIASVQDRVGIYLGILGKDEIDLNQVQTAMLLEEEDINLLAKVQKFLNGVESFLNIDLSGMGSMAHADSQLRLLNTDDGGWGSQLLKVIAYMLEKSSIWSTVHLMSVSLETQANHFTARAQGSIQRRQSGVYIC
ncbi:hypothetical protein BGHDH14_bgh00206 [Blumeria hordei DH14]|uniref:C2H2-type domain-containing protein n=1 Tax=Blumeria graminis f. sp. hordei (strain DH14) TaxID=546991 RepID=N1J6B4_BLUG1|nr:hypothetical protein BGHDH14_bgh00206 [Blumeria hordei DH14]